MNIQTHDAAEKEWIAEIAKAACIRLTEEELARFVHEVKSRLLLLAEMEDFATDADWKKTAVGEEALRADFRTVGLPREQLLSASARRDGAYFSVPATFGEGDGAP